MVEDVVPYLKHPDDMIIKQGEESTDFYFLAEGQCQISMNDHFVGEVILNKLLNKGTYFGEVGIIFDCPRTATVKAVNYCTFAKINSVVFSRLSCGFIKHMKLKTKKYKDKLKLLKIKLLKQVEYFEIEAVD